MKENRQHLQAGEAMKAPNVQGGLPHGSPKICPFPSRPDTETQAAKDVAEKLKIPFVDPLSAHIEPTAVALIDPDVAMRRQALPIRLVNDTLLVAMASPDEPIAIRSLELLTGCKIRP
ncbi:MAG: hypothetical protein KAT27_01375, partial [Desulfobacterales bacterium]|nr:hypothetical protein [Desulfobacterales bacterium]